MVNALAALGYPCMWEWILNLLSRPPAICRLIQHKATILRFLLIPLGMADLGLLHVQPVFRFSFSLNILLCLLHHHYHHISIVHVTQCLSLFNIFFNSLLILYYLQFSHIAWFCLELSDFSFCFFFFSTSNAVKV